MKTHYRQGDVLLLEVDQIPDGATDITPKSGPIVLALGEATGHAHAIQRGGVRLLERGARRYLDVKKPVSIKHEEHDAIALPPGLYETRDFKGVGIIQVEYAPGELRRVED